MKYKFPLILFVCAFLLSVTSVDAQIRKIPAAVTDAFKEKYPSASGVEWRDKLSVFTAVFVEDGINHEARFNSKGGWLATENVIEQDVLPQPIKDGFDKSKYADWNIEKVHKIELPGDEIQYRLLVGKTDLQKKNLIYNEKGRLLKEKITL